MPAAFLPGAQIEDVVQAVTDNGELGHREIERVARSARDTTQTREEVGCPPRTVQPPARLT